MRCAGCGFEGPSDFAFCPKCGSKLQVPCPSCAFVCPPDFAFCPKCGTRLAPPGEGAVRPEPAAEPASRADAKIRKDVRASEDGAAETDRRLVSVVFADLSGFTALSERLDPEDVRAFQSDLFHEMDSAIRQYEGFVEKFVGDAVMAVFGAPAAHEDDPERALQAALAMHGRMAALSRRWEGRLGRPLALHVGVNTGPVVAGTLGAASGAAYAVTGETVNTASRLQSAAQPGQTLVSLATYRLTQHAFSFEPLGDLALKGKTDRVPAYLVVGALDAHRSARGLEALGLVAPMVGRDDELAQVVGAFERMVRGRAQVVSLIGEAGVGKSRLLGEFFGRLEATGQLHAATVRRTTCSPLGGQPYGVMAAFFREAYGVAPEDTLEAAQLKLTVGLRSLGAEEDDAKRIAPVLGYVLGLGSGDLVRAVEPEQLKRQIFLALRMLIERRLRQGPLVLVVEDLHWADAASVELLRFVVDRLADRPLMLLVSYRPTFDVARLVVSRATHTAIRLAPLSAEQSASLLGALFGASVRHVSPALRDLIVRRGGGNPFFLEEVLRGLIAGGVLVREAAGWACTTEVAAVEVPPTIQGLLLARFDRLPPPARRLIHEAAVLGPRFDLKLLQAICSEPSACEAVLEILHEAELVEELPRAPAADKAAATAEGQWRFTHALVQEVVYHNLLLRRRMELHGRAGLALERLCGGHPERLEDVEALGHHFSLSDDKARGARYLLAAGDWARAIYANDDAARHYERALETLHECEACEAERLAVQERLGDLLGPLGRREAAVRHYEIARGGYEAAGDRPAQARVHRKMGGLRWDAGDRDRALACCRTGLDLLEGQAEHIEIAHLYQEMGRIAFRTGDNLRAMEWAKQALAQAERLVGGSAGSAPTDETQRDAAAAISHAYNTLGVGLARTGRAEEAVEHIERSVVVAEAHGLLHVACRGYANLGVLYSTLDPQRAIGTCAKGLETAKKVGDLGFQSRLYANLAVAYCALTDRCDEEGIQAAQAAIELDRQLGQLDHLAVPLIVLGQIHQCHGDAEAALRCYEEALGLAEDAREPQLLFPCYDGLATLYLDMGDAGQAEEYMRKAQHVCQEAGLDPDSLMVLPFLC